MPSLDWDPHRRFAHRHRRGERWTLSDTPLAGAALLHEAGATPEFARSGDIVNVEFAASVTPERRLQILATGRLTVVDHFPGLPLLVARVRPGADPQQVGQTLLRTFPGEVEAFGLEYELATP